MDSPPKTSAAVVVIVAWLALVGAIYAYILLLSPERGSGMDGMLYGVLGILGGGISLVLAILRLSPLNKGIHRRSALIPLVVAASFFGLIGVVRYGSYLYRLDQDDAKSFVDRRVAEIQTGGSDATFPATQDEFVNKKPLPRLLRDKKFYFSDGGKGFHIEIRVDFDGGWMFSSLRPEWTRST